MTQQTDPIVSLIELNDDEFAKLSDDELSNLNLKLADLQRTLFKDVDEGVAPPPVSIRLAMPSEMSMTADHSTLLMALVNNGQHKWEVYPTSNIFILLRHYVSGKTWLATPLLNKRRARVQPKSAQGVAPNAAKAGSWSAAFHKLKLDEMFTGEMPDGNYTATALYFDLASNSSLFKLKGDVAKDDKIKHVVNVTKSFSLDVPDTVKPGSSMQLNLDVTLDEAPAELWHANIIALTLDERPIVIPFSIKAGSSKQISANIKMNEKSNAWQTGRYQIYVDVGDRVVGPEDMLITE